MTVNNYFGFAKNPFPKYVENKEVFLYKEFEDLSTRLQFFLSHKGIFLLTGLIGSGKTTALKVFASNLNPNNYRVEYMHNNHSTRRDLFRTMLLKLNVTPPFSDGDAREMLRKQLMEMYFIKKTTPLFIFDEAQNLNGFILEEIRLLSNFDFDSISPALFIISGHNKLKQRIVMRENEALNQRITMRFHFNGMNEEQTISYIQHNLKNAGSSNAIFTDTVLKKIFEVSTGIPRKINNICNDLLLSALTLDKKIIDEYVYEQTSGEWL
jgi:general secretion pathway protein A